MRCGCGTARRDDTDRPKGGCCAARMTSACPLPPPSVRTCTCRGASAPAVPAAAPSPSPAKAPPSPGAAPAADGCGSRWKAALGTTCCHQAPCKQRGNATQPRGSCGTGQGRMGGALVHMRTPAGSPNNALNALIWIAPGPPPRPLVIPSSRSQAPRTRRARPLPPPLRPLHPTPISLPWWGRACRAPGSNSTSCASHCARVG